MICCSNPRYEVFLSALSLFAIVYGLACLFFQENGACLHRGEAETPLPLLMDPALAIVDPI